MIKKAVVMRKHLEVNRKDKDGKFRLILVESRIHRLARYYKVRAHTEVHALFGLAQVITCIFRPAGYLQVLLCCGPGYVGLPHGAVVPGLQPAALRSSSQDVSRFEHAWMSLAGALSKALERGRAGLCLQPSVALLVCCARWACICS